MTTPTSLHSSPQSVSSAPSVLVDAETAARQLGVQASWMLREARADRLPHVRLGKYVRFDSEALDVWWRARMRGPMPTRTGGQPVSSARRGQP